MDSNWIIAAFVVIDTLMEQLGHCSDVRAQVPDSEMVTIYLAGLIDEGSLGAGSRLRDGDDCCRRRHVFWQPSRTGRADDALVRLSVGPDQRLAF